MQIKFFFSRAVIQSCTAYISEDSSDRFFVECIFMKTIFVLMFSDLSCLDIEHEQTCLA